MTTLLASAADRPAPPHSVDQDFQRILRNLEPQPSKADTSPPLELPATAAPAPATRPQNSLEQAIESFAARFWNGRTDQLKAALWRIERIRPALEGLLVEEGVPPRFAAIVLVESGASTASFSSKSAGGLWQLVPATARRYGLVVSGRRDDRIGLVPATRAAARYLRDLHRMFGDWRLALAAYNAGAGVIERAIDRAHTANFDVLSGRGLIPEETRNYVPAVLAAINLLAVRGETEDAHLRP